MDSIYQTMVPLCYLKLRTVVLTLSLYDLISNCLTILFYYEYVKYGMIMKYTYMLMKYVC